MAVFEVFFSGLICFIDDNDDPSTKTAAVLLPENGTHDPWITFGGAAVALTGDVTFSPPLPTGAAVCEEPFMTTVPSLRRYTKAGTQRRKDAPGLRVTLPKGKLSVASHFPKRALYAMHGEEIGRQDVAKLTVLLIETDMNTIDFKIGSDQKHVAISSFIVIENAAKRHPKPNEHWHLQRKMTTAKNDSEIADIVELQESETSNPANTVHIAEATAAIHNPHEEAALQTQCSNTQWP